MQTCYLRKVSLEQAPQSADCLTIIHYIFTTIISKVLPLYYIGDMPRMLTRVHNWEMITIDKHTNPLPGDLLFVKHPRSKRQISHVALFLSANQLFHLSQTNNGSSIETIDSFMQFWKQSLTAHQALNYYDGRNIFCHQLAALSRFFGS